MCQAGKLTNTENSLHVTLDVFGGAEIATLSLSRTPCDRRHHIAARPRKSTRIGATVAVIEERGDNRLVSSGRVIWDPSLMVLIARRPADLVSYADTTFR